MEKAVEVFAAVNFLVIGLSHVFQREAWIEFFAKLHSLGRPGPFAEGFLYLNFGALIVAFHNVWSGPEVILTVIGWIHVAKAFYRFVAPEAVLRLYQRMGSGRAWQIQVAGGLLAAFAVFLLLRVFPSPVL